MSHGFVRSCSLVLLTALAIASGPDLAADQTFAYHGTTVGKARFKRPDGVGPELSTLGWIGLQR